MAEPKASDKAAPPEPKVETTTPTFEDSNTGLGKPAYAMTAAEYSRYFNPVAAYLTFIKPA